MESENLNFYPLYATETRQEAYELTRELNRRAGVPGIAKAAKPEPGALPKPYRYMVLTTSETLRKNHELVHEVRLVIRHPRFPMFWLAKEWCFDVLIASIEALTRLVRKLKGETA